MSLADQKMDTMPVGIPNYFLGVDTDGLPVLASPSATTLDVSNYASFALASAAAVSAGKSLVIPPGNHVIAASVTMNVRCEFAAGAYLTIASGQTVTFSKSVYAPMEHIFRGAGSVAFAVGYQEFGYPEWWGADHATSDCLAAFEASQAAVPVTLCQAATYYLSSTLVWDTPNRQLHGVGREWAAEGDATRLLVLSATANCLQIGPTTEPATINDFPQGIVVKNLACWRSTAPTPPASGTAGPTGVKVQYVLGAMIEHVSAPQHSNGWWVDGVVNTDINYCTAFRSIVGSTGVNDYWIGMKIGDVADIGAAGHNASLYIKRFNAAIGGAPALTESQGMLISTLFADTFIEDSETTSCRTGFAVIGNATTDYGNADLRIINPVSDSFTYYGVFIQGVSTEGSVFVTGGYSAPAAVSTALAGIRVDTSGGLIDLSFHEVPCGPNAVSYDCIGLYLSDTDGVTARGLHVIDSNRPVALLNTNKNFSLEVGINNTNETAAIAAVYQGGTASNGYIRPMVKGKAGAFPQGVNLVSTGASEVTVDCSNIDPACITGGAANRLVENAVQITAKATAFGANLRLG